MGGYGSGRSAEKTTFEDGLPLDLDKLIRDRRIRPGTWAGSLVWRTTRTGRETASAAYVARLDVDTGTGFVELSYRITDRQGDRHDVRERVPLEGTRQRYGGWRWYFRCPVTGRRCSKLYLLPGGRRFAARQAWRACYRSQQQSPCDRAIDQAHKLRDRLEASSYIGDSVLKPKGMRQRTFARHQARLERHEAVVNGGMLKLAARLDRRRSRRAG